MRRIIYTRPDHGVSVIVPSPNCMKALTLGGGLLPRSRRDEQIARFIDGGIRESAAVAWVDGLISGGKTTAEALGLIRDKNVPRDGILPDVVDVDEIPSDRWFRDAWTRSHNGGPITVSREKAKTVQVGRILSAHRVAEKRLKADPEAFLTGKALPELDRGWIRMKLDAARHLEEIRQVWPLWLN